MAESEFVDGPASGARLALARVPIYLRVVIDGDGKVDALDQLDDEPRPGECIYVYRRTSWGHICARGGSGGASGVFGVYVQVPWPEFAGVDLSDREQWAKWANAQPPHVA